MLNVFARLSCGIPMLKCVDNFYYLPFYSTSEKEDKEKSEFVLLEKKNHSAGFTNSDGLLPTANI